MLAAGSARRSSTAKRKQNPVPFLGGLYPKKRKK